MDLDSEMLSHTACKDLSIKKYKENENVSSCNTSDCSFEMDPEDEVKGLRLCSIDELFASPPVVHESENNEVNYSNSTSDDASVGKTEPLLMFNQPVVHEFENEVDYSISSNSDVSTTKTESLLFDLPAEQSVTSLENHKIPSLCWSCQKNKPKYKCPQCFKKTCSLACVKLHKERLNCHGERNKTDFVRKESFTESCFLSDYRFLEEVNRCVSKRNNFPRPYFKSKGMKLLANKAYAMKIRLQILPTSFKRRRENTTFYCFKNRQFLWHVEWNFVDCCVTIVDKRLPDSKPLSECVSKFIVPSTNNHRYDSRLNEYNLSESLSFYLKKECTKANETLYHKLDPEKDLRSNLQGKTIIEYPSVFVALPKQSRIYDLSLCSE